MHRPRYRTARSFFRRIVTIFGHYDALNEVRSRRQAKLLLRQFMR